MPSPGCVRIERSSRKFLITDKTSRAKRLALAGRKGARPQRRPVSGYWTVRDQLLNRQYQRNRLKLELSHAIHGVDEGIFTHPPAARRE
jgi:hypothetical protein